MILGAQKTYFDNPIIYKYQTENFVLWVNYTDGLKVIRPKLGTEKFNALQNKLDDNANLKKIRF